MSHFGRMHVFDLQGLTTFQAITNIVRSCPRLCLLSVLEREVCLSILFGRPTVGAVCGTGGADSTGRRAWDRLFDTKWVFESLGSCQKDWLFF